MGARGWGGEGRVVCVGETFEKIGACVGFGGVRVEGLELGPLQGA
jgi:hypothetical protein